MSEFKKATLSTIAVAVAMTALPAAAAGISGYEVVTQETAIDSSLEKQLQIDCPAGKYALGAGWAAVDKTGASLEGSATLSLPSWDGSGWIFNVRNITSYEPNWKLRARIICADVEGV